MISAGSAIRRTVESDLESVDLHPEMAPLPIRRFTEQMMARHPSVAMKCATDIALMEYRRVRNKQESLISVTKLCEVLEIQLLGSRPRPKGPLYSVENYKPRVSHTGSLFLEARSPLSRLLITSAMKPRVFVSPTRLGTY